MKSNNVCAVSTNSVEHLPLVLSPKDVAVILGVSRNTAYEVLHRRGFPALRVGKQYRVPRDKFMIWLNSASEVDVA